MLNKPTTISELIDRWETLGDFADAIGCGYEAARQMKRRDRIAPHYWARLISVAETRGIPDIDYGWLAARYPDPKRSVA